MSGTIYSARYKIDSGGGTYTGITLSNPATQNPATIASYVYVNDGAAVLGETGTVWTVSNQGLLITYGVSSHQAGVVLLSGGTVINGSTLAGDQGQYSTRGAAYADGRIAAGPTGVAIYGSAGTVLNDGVIGNAGVGITLADGGLVANGGSGDTIAYVGSVQISGAAGTVLNDGTIGESGAASGRGIDLLAGGLVQNYASGYLPGGTTIVTAAGTVINAGTMSGTTALLAGGALDNTGSISSQVTMALGGLVTNAGTISGGTYGIVVAGAAGTVVNDGAIDSSGFGVTFAVGGTILNGSALYTGASIAGGVVASGAPGTVLNFGTIGQSGNGIYLLAGGLVQNYAGGTLSGGTTIAGVADAGTVINAGSMSGVTLAVGGTLGNSGTITGPVSLGAAGIVTNLGALLGSFYAVAFTAGAGTVVNDGLIDSAGAGVTLAEGGTILNGTSVYTTAAIYGGVVVAGAPGTVVNDGTIGQSGSTDGITLLAGGVVQNASGGTLAAGVTIAGAAGTVANAGTIIGLVTLSAQGLVTNTAGLLGSTYAVAITGGAGTVVNDGAIDSTGPGVTLADGGTIVNGAPGSPGAVIYGGVVLSGASGTVLNAGTIGQSETAGGIELLAGGLVQNNAAGSLPGGTTITGAAGTLINAGRMNQPTALYYGGSVTNMAGGLILYGLTLSGGAFSSLQNAGTITGLVTLAGTAVVTNTGTLDGGAIGLAASGSVTLVNGLSGATGGLITGSSYGVSIGGAGARVTNDATIESAGGSDALLLTDGGTVENAGLLLQTAGSDVTAAALALKSGGTAVNTGTLYGIPIGAYLLGGTLLNASLIAAHDAGGASAIGVNLDAAELQNTGTLQATGADAVGAVLTGSATLGNSGLLAATATGIGQSALVAVGNYVIGGGTVINSGTLMATIGGIASGTLADGILVTGTLGVLIENTGTVLANTGVYVDRSQRVGALGIYSYIDPKPNVTVINSGLIEGTKGTAIQFGDGSNRLILQPGAQLSGAVIGGSFSNVIELAAGIGTLSGLGSLVTNFTSLQVDAGADWQLSGSLAAGISLTNDGTLLANQGMLAVRAGLHADTGGTGTLAVAGHGLAALYGAVAANQTVQFIDLVGTLAIGSLAAFSGTIAGFASGDSIFLPGQTATAASYANHLLTISNAASILGELAVSKAYSGDSFTVTQDSAGSTITTDAPCFASGTRLATARGEVPVEALTAGTQMRTASGALRPVIWLGHLRINCRAHPKPEEVLPIRILAHAFGPNLPRRDLLLSPDHAIAWLGALIPVRYLVNGLTVRQETVAEVEYWHVELGAHDVLLAEGLPAESYLDTGNRAQFSGPYDNTRHPDLSGSAALMVDGPAVTRARAHLLARADALGWQRPAHFLHLEIGERTLVPASSHGGQHRFLLPAGHNWATLVSDASVPAERDPTSHDRRQLGVCVSGLLVAGRPVPLQHRILAAGFHPVEKQGRGEWRWTDGRGTIELPNRVSVLEVTLRER